MATSHCGSMPGVGLDTASPSGISGAAYRSSPQGQPFSGTTWCCAAAAAKPDRMIAPGSEQHHFWVRAGHQPAALSNQDGLWWWCRVSLSRSKQATPIIGLMVESNHLGWGRSQPDSEGSRPNFGTSTSRYVHLTGRYRRRGIRSGSGRAAETQRSWRNGN